MSICQGPFRCNGFVFGVDVTGAAQPERGALTCRAERQSVTCVHIEVTVSMHLCEKRSFNLLPQSEHSMFLAI